MDDDPWLRELLDDQDGLVTRSQLRALGRPPGAVRWALGRRWYAVLPSVVCTTGPQLTARQRLVAAMLHAGAGSMIGSLSAAAWHGVTAAGDPRVHVLTPATRHARNAGFVVVRRTSRPDPHPWHRGAVTLTSPARAVVDAARDAGTADAALAIVCEAVERRLVSAPALRHEVESGPRTGSGLVRRAVQVAEAGAWSVPEVELIRLVEGCPELPPAWPNPDLTAVDGTRLPTPDLWFDAVGLAVQVHSRQWHSSPDQWDATVMSDGVFAEYGIPIVGVTPRAVRRDPERVRRRLVRACAEASRRPRPRVIARRA